MINIIGAKIAAPPALRGALQSLAAAAVVTALADWLFYLHRPGISVAIFALALSLAVALANPIRAGRIGLSAAPILLVLAVLPAVEDFGVLSLVFAAVGAALFALMITGWPARPAGERIGDVAWMIIGGPFRLVADVGEAAREARERDAVRSGADWLKAWVVPLAVGSVFVALFAAANPVIAQWFASTDGSWWKAIDLQRMVFWLVVIALIWGFLPVRFAAKPSLQDLLAEPSSLSGGAPSAAAMPADVKPAATPSDATVGVLFGHTAILRSLVLFNALFAVQTLSDAAYLWGGVALPAGMSYASYAHRGAYPLIVTALLAAAFVLAAMRPGTSAARSRLVRALVYLWIGQNVMLVMSSILRLDLYVDVYALTGWRCAAFVWMLLVAIGLVLIVARIALDRSNRWLVWRNAAALGLTLYVCSFVDFAAVIADFNVAHSQDVSGVGLPADIAYLCDLGPAAIPALDALAATGQVSTWRMYQMGCRDRLITLARTRAADWRAWTFRAYRLERRIEHRSARSPGQDDPSAARINGG